MLTLAASHYVTHHHQETLVHYIPMKQCNVLLCIEPNHEGAHLLIDAPDHIKSTPNERLVNQAIRAYDVNPKSCKGKTTFIVTDLQKTIYKK